MARLAYSTDLTDEQWAVIESFLPVWKAKRVSPAGYTGCYDLREIINAMLALTKADQPGTVDLDYVDVLLD
jgi:transposase